MTEPTAETARALPADWTPAVCDAFWTAVNAPTYDESAAATLAFAQLLAAPATVPPPADRAAYAQGIRDAIAELERDAFGAIPRLRRLAAEAQPFESARDSNTHPKADPKAGSTIHACPRLEDNGKTPCCHRPPFEMRGDRLTRDPDKVTCTGPAAGVRQEGAQP